MRHMPLELRVQDIIYLAASACGAVRMRELPSPSDLALGVQVANLILAEWAGMGISAIRSLVEDTVTLTAGKSSYTIGPVDSAVGASQCDIVTAKPVNIISATVTDMAGPTEYDCSVVGWDVWDSISDKAISSARPYVLYYEPGAVTGTIYLYNTPSSNTIYQLKFRSIKYVTFFSDSGLTDIVYIEPLAYNALIDSLAVRLFRHYHGVKTKIPDDLLSNEYSSDLQMKAAFSTRLTSDIEVPSSPRGGVYNIYTQQDEGR